MNWLSHRRSYSPILKSVALSLLLTGASATVASAQVKPEVVLPPTAEGDWVKLDTVGVGTFSNFGLYAAKPKLTAEFQARQNNAPRRPPQGEYRVGNSIVVHPHPCGYSGAGPGGGIEFSSYAVHVVRSKAETLIVDEIGYASGRHIYTDGRPLPPPGVIAPTGNGYSVGHWEPDGTLVIQTGNLTPGGFGTPRSTETILEQRYHPSASGDHLTITYTWKDPKIFAEPFTYTAEFERTAALGASESYCDATDTREATSSVEPEQKK